MREIRSTTEVAPGILFVEGPASNWTVFHGGGSVELVDCGYPADRPLVEASIRQADAEPAALRRILITHGHSDHLGASRELAADYGARVQTAADELPNVRREVTEQVTVADLLPSVLKRGTVRWAVEAIRAGGLGDVGVPAATAFDGDTLALSTGHRLQVVATPGHTSNHLCFALAEADALFTGDHVMGWSTTVVAPPDGDMADYMASLEKLHARSDAVYYPAHGPQIDKPRQLVRGMIGHRRQRERQVVNLLNEGIRQVAQMVPRMYKGVDERLWPAAGQSVLAHLLDLQRRGIARRSGEEWWMA